MFAMFDAALLITAPAAFRPESAVLNRPLIPLIAVTYEQIRPEGRVTEPAIHRAILFPPIQR